MVKRLATCILILSFSFSGITGAVTEIKDSEIGYLSYSIPVSYSFIKKAALSHNTITLSKRHHSLIPIHDSLFALLVSSKPRT